MSNQDIFKEAMKGVKPLNGQRQRINRKNTTPKQKSHMVSRTPSLTDDELLFEPPNDTTPEQRLFFARPGLQIRTIRKMKKGDFAIEATLDLHGETVGRAHRLLHAFLENCYQSKQRYLLIIHGKGSCKIKSAVYHWLREQPTVLAFSSAIPTDGGAGALYLLLKALPTTK